MMKIIYGESNFEKLVRTNSLYVDRTPYLEVLENFFSSYLVFLRPRRFGKSLFLSVLEYYYDIRHKNKFDTLFGKYYIGKNPTPLANQYLILKFDFSQIDTSSFEKTYDGFLDNAITGAAKFYGKYQDIFDLEDINSVKTSDFPAKVIQHIIERIAIKAPNHKIYLLVDEYDHFANEILSFRFDEFTRMVGQNGFVRKFYEAIKVGTQSGVIDRLFITGISPLTLDSFTSGFNISVNITLRPEFNEMMGFTEAEVIDILKGINISASEIPKTIELMKAWYDGYLFSKEATTRLYNSDMVLYFATEYLSTGKYPEELLDPNIASDYGKVRKLFKIKNKEKEHFKYLDELLEKGEIQSSLVRQFRIEQQFVKKDFISVLFYSGILTIAEANFLWFTFRMPNYVIKELYYQYFHQMLLEQSGLNNTSIELQEKLLPLALENNMQPLVDYTQMILTELSNRDKMRFDEKYVKIIFTSVFFNVGIYNIHNEKEVKKSEHEKGYVDILLTTRPPFPTKYQVAIELKYLKKEDAKKAETVKKAAVNQLKAYLQNDPYLQGLENLKAYVVLFVGNEGMQEEVII